MTKLPRGLRNNNPGNIRNSQRTDWQGEVDESAKNDNSFEEFETIAYGYRALIKLLFYKSLGSRNRKQHIRLH